jgi:selenide,water dikinase
MKGLKFPHTPNTLVAFDTSDDAGAYQISDDIAIIQTVDFITPVVNDPYKFGQISAANSLSDVFAMGAKVCTALNIVAYDSCHITKEMLNEILRGGLDKVIEAGGVVLGGHTIEDLEMKYGLSVTGIVHPNKIVRNNTIRPGDKIILTKPIGMGVISTSIKADMAPQSAIDKAAFHMSFLNKAASEIAVENGVNAMTDVTGFGLLGHLYEMTNDSASVHLDYGSIPIIEEAFELAEIGLFPGGSYQNEKYYKPNIFLDRKDCTQDQLMLLYDAQTSGGLMISVPGEKADKLLDELMLAGLEWCSIIGEVFDGKGRKIIIG